MAGVAEYVAGLSTIADRASVNPLFYPLTAHPLLIAPPGRRLYLAFELQQYLFPAPERDLPQFQRIFPWGKFGFPRGKFSLPWGNQILPRAN